MTATQPKVYIAGAGLAGLAAAVRLADAGVLPSIVESAGHAGGRCRSFFDRTLGRTIDNGNHLIMSGNASARDYLDRIGARDALIGPAHADYPFADIATGARWTVRINDGLIPFWVFDSRRRIPGTGVLDYCRAAAIALAGPEKTVADVVDKSNPLYQTFWEPLTLAVLNTTPDIGQARLLWSVIRETFLLGGEASRPLVADRGLGPAFIDPALRYLEERGVAIRFGDRLRGARLGDDRASGLDLESGAVDLIDTDEVILAIPPSRLKQILPDIDPPEDNASILNVHYLTSAPIPREALGDGPFVAALSSDAQWIFVRDDVISLTVSASHAIGLDETPNEQVVGNLWRETQSALGLGDVAYDAVRVIRERRATPDQSPAGASKRLAPATRWRNVTLAGDHTDTGVPATIEGSIRSGYRAADIVLRRLERAA